MPNYFEVNFGVTPAMIEQSLAEAMRNGGDWADLFFQHTVESHIALEDDVVNRAYSNVELGVGIRTVTGDQTGFAYTEALTAEAMRSAARTAAAIAQGGSAPAFALKPFQPPTRYDTEIDWSLAPVEQLVALLDQLNQDVRAADPWVEKVSLSIGTQQQRILIASTDGPLVFDNQPMARLVLSIVMNHDGERQSNTVNIAARRGLDFFDQSRLARLVQEGIERTRILFEAQKPSAGEMPVILAAGSSGILLHEAIGHGMEADFNRKGISIFANRIGTSIASPEVTIVDSGLHPDLRGSINVDDEGTLSQETRLVENGVLRSYLHDKISARHFGVAPTGNGRRESFRHPPLPRMRNTYMLPGEHAPEELIASVKKGIYCISFTNGQVQIGAGDYAFYVKNGYLIEDGKITAPIKDVNIIGNGPESLARITMVANDFELDDGGWTCGKGGQRVPVSLGLPSVLVSGINVGGIS